MHLSHSLPLASHLLMYRLDRVPVELSCLLFLMLSDLHSRIIWRLYVLSWHSHSSALAGKSRVATHMDIWTVFEGQESRRLSMRVWYPSAQRKAQSNARYLFSLISPSFRTNPDPWSSCDAPTPLRSMPGKILFPVLTRVWQRCISIYRSCAFVPTLLMTVVVSSSSPLKVLFPRIPAYLLSHLAATRTSSIFGGKMSSRREKYPVIFFSHDLRWYVFWALFKNWR